MYRARGAFGVQNKETLNEEYNCLLQAKHIHIFLLFTLSHWRSPPADLLTQQGISLLIPTDQADDRSMSAPLMQSRRGHSPLLEMDR